MEYILYVNICCRGFICVGYIVKVGSTEDKKLSSLQYCNFVDIKYSTSCHSI